MSAWRKLGAQLYSRKQHLLFRMDTATISAGIGVDATAPAVAPADPASKDIQSVGQASVARAATEPGQDDTMNGAIERVVVSTDAAPSPQQQAAREHLVAMTRQNRAYLADVDRGFATGLLLLCNGRPVHYGFVFHRNRTMCMLGLPPGSALLAHAFTDPLERGKGLQTRSVKARVRLAGQRGHGLAFSETSCDNIASQRGLARAGMEPVGPVTVIRILRVFIYRPVRPPGFARFGLCI